MSALVLPKMPKHYVELSSVRLAKNAISYAVDCRYPALIHGLGGHGKSVALYQLSRDFEHTYVSINENSKTVSGLFRLIIRVFGFYCHANILTANALADAVYDGLARYHSAYPRHALIVDEIGDLQKNAQKELLRLHETTGMPLVLSGNDVRLMQTNAREAGLDQIVSRIGWRCEFEGLLPQDCVDLGTAFNVEGLDAYEALKAFGSTRSLRDLAKLLDNAEHVTGGQGGIRLHHLKAAVAELFGGRDGLRLLTPNNQYRIAGRN